MKWSLVVAGNAVVVFVSSYGAWLLQMLELWCLLKWSYGAWLL